MSQQPQFGRYVLGPRIARGGMGEVFLATQTGLGAFAKPLVLKLLLPHLTSSERAVEMFLDEARLASRMNHSNVVSIFDVGVIEGRYFIAMELVRGVSLAKLVVALRERNEALPVDLWVYVARCLCDGLHHAHDQRGADGKALDLIHRDVTLENVLVSTDGQVKLTDFGIARAQNDADAPSVAGKRGYVAPEVLAHQPYDRRVDVFGAAVTLRSLATLERPHEREGDDVAPLRTALSPGTLEALARGAATVASDRFDTARALRDALPPLTAFDASERLGALVQRICAEQVTALDDDVQRTGLQTKPGTQALSLLATGSIPSGLLEPAAAKPSRWRRVLPMAALAVLGGGAAVWFSAPGPATAPTQTVTPPPSVAPSEPIVAALDDAGANDVVPDAPKPLVVVEPPPSPSPGARLPKTPKPTKRSTPVSSVASPEEGVGTLTVDAVPWAMVSLNGKPIGETPIARLKVAAGPLVLTFSNPETGRTRQRQLVVRAGQTQVVTEDLR